MLVLPSSEPHSISRPPSMPSVANHIEADDDERAIEISTTKAIFPELVIDPKDCFAASLRIPITPAKPLPVLFSLNDEALLKQQQQLQASPPTTETASGEEVQHISHLPPLRLEISLPPQYPFDLPPRVQLESELS